GDVGRSVEGEGAVRRRRSVAIPRRGVEHDRPVRMCTLEIFPGRKNGARRVQLWSSRVKRAVVAQSIEGLLDPLSGGLPCSECEIIGLELVRDHRDLFTLTVAEVHMGRLRVSKR